MLLNEVDNVLDAFPDAVADDEQQELATSEVARDVLVAPRGECRRVIEDLADHFASRLRVAPELELCEGKPAEGIDVQRVHVAGSHRQLATDRNGARVG